MSNHVQKILPEQNHKPLLSKADLAAIEADPALMETFSRLLGAVNLDNLFRTMQEPDINPATRIEFQKLLNKMGKLEPDAKANNSGTGPQVVINITRAKDNMEEIVIDAAMDTIPDAT
jgi:hypothetical protein